MVLAVIEERPRLVERDEAPQARVQRAGAPARVARGDGVRDLAVVGEPDPRAGADARADGVEVVLVERVAPAADRAAGVLEQGRGVDLVGLARGGAARPVVDRRVRRGLAAGRHRAVEGERPELGTHRDGDVLRAVELVGRGRAGAQPRALLARPERPAAHAGAARRRPRPARPASPGRAGRRR